MDTLIDLHHRERVTAAFSALSLGEVQLLLLGLWVIGQENRVDPRLNAEYGWLLNALSAASQGTAQQVFDEQAGLPHPQVARHQGTGSAVVTGQKEQG